MSNQFGLCSSVGKSLGISPQNVKMTSLGINPHVNLAVIPGHPIIVYRYCCQVKSKKVRQSVGLSVCDFVGIARLYTVCTRTYSLPYSV